MNYVKFANTDVEVSEMCLGTMMFGDRCDEAESARILDMSIDQGVNFIDTAAVYCKGETEKILGKIMQGKRNQLFVGTKVGGHPTSDWIQTSIDESLTRMKMDYVDLYMIHWPRENMNTFEMMAGLNKVVEAGKARFVGCCNFPAWLLAHCNAIAGRNDWAKLVCNQIPYNLFERGVEVEVLPQAVVENIAITAYRPLLLGILAGKYKPGEPIPEDSRGVKDERIPMWLEKYDTGLRQFNQFASERGWHPAQLSVAWLRKSQGLTSPIVGVSSEKQLSASFAAFDIELTDEEYNQVTAMFDTAVKEESGGSFIVNPIVKTTK
jgi:aryl-alcohol dehydrogenase-like predicted oxidoreductase